MEEQKGQKCTQQILGLFISILQMKIYHFDFSIMSTRIDLFSAEMFIGRLDFDLWF